MKNDYRPAVRKFEGTTLEKIEAVLRQEKGIPPLSVTEEKILRRYETAVSILRGRSFPRTEQECVKLLSKAFNISERQARIDVNSAQKIFGSLIDTNRAFKRHLASEWATKAIALAFEAKDLNAVNSALKNFAAINGLDKNDPDVPDPEAYRAHKFVIEISLKDSNKKFSIDTNKLGGIEDADFEAIISSVEGEELSAESMKILLEGEEDADKED